MAFKKVVISKVDLDTTLTAYLQGVRSENMLVEVVRGSASGKDLADPTVLCIECGGTGRVIEGNFDHHGGGEENRAASTQAFEQMMLWMRKIQPLVRYVAEVDCGTLTRHERADGPSLVWLFSGMLLSIKKPEEQLQAGLTLLDTVVTLNLDPYGSMSKVFSILPEAKNWFQTKKDHERWARQVATHVQWFVSDCGAVIAAVETSWFGAPGLLSGLKDPESRSADVTVSLNPVHQQAGKVYRKFSVTSRKHSLKPVLEELQKTEPGWGGPNHMTIIGSTLGEDSLFSLEEVVQMVVKRFEKKKEDEDGSLISQVA
jgi:hypothetical protein